MAAVAGEAHDEQVLPRACVWSVSRGPIDSEVDSRRQSGSLRAAFEKNWIMSPAEAPMRPVVKVISSPGAGNDLLTPGRVHTVSMEAASEQRKTRRREEMRELAAKETLYRERCEALAHRCAMLQASIADRDERIRGLEAKVESQSRQDEVAEERRRADVEAMKATQREVDETEARIVTLCDDARDISKSKAQAEAEAAAARVACARLEERVAVLRLVVDAHDARRLPEQTRNALASVERENHSLELDLREASEATTAARRDMRAARRRRVAADDKATAVVDEARRVVAAVAAAARESEQDAEIRRLHARIDDLLARPSSVRDDDEHRDAYAEAALLASHSNKSVGFPRESERDSACSQVPHLLSSRSMRTPRNLISCVITEYE